MALKSVTAIAPSSWASYLINADASGLSEREKAACDAWLTRQGMGLPYDCEDYGYCRTHDAMPEYEGLAADCQKYVWLVEDADERVAEITAAVLRDYTDERGIVDEVAMRALFDARDLSVEERGRVWRAVTGSSPQIEELREQLREMTPEDRAGFLAWARRAL